MVYLPYSDDVRQPEADTSFTGHAHPQADNIQIEAAEKMMAALSLPEFASSNIPNPTLQRHYQVFHAMLQMHLMSVTVKRHVPDFVPRWYMRTFKASITHPNSDQSWK